MRPAVDPVVCPWPLTDLADSHANLSMLVNSIAWLASGAYQFLGDFQTWPLSIYFSPLSLTVFWCPFPPPHPLNACRTYSLRRSLYNTHTHRSFWHFCGKAELWGRIMWAVLLFAVDQGEPTKRRPTKIRVKATNWIVHSAYESFFLGKQLRTIMVKQR